MNLNKLILVKHSLPEMDPAFSASRWHLSRLGRDRCGELTARLSNYSPDIIISSSEPKAIETAELLADPLKLTTQVVAGLHEHDRRSVPFMEKNKFERAVASFFEKADVLVFGNETADQAFTRFKNAVISIVEHHPDLTIVIVAHGTVIALFVSRLTGSNPLPIWKALGLPSFVVLSLPDMVLLSMENIE